MLAAPLPRLVPGLEGHRFDVRPGYDELIADAPQGQHSHRSAPLFANKLLSRTAKIASSATPRCPTRRCGSSRNARVLPKHCLLVTSDLTREGCCIHEGRCEGQRRRSLAGLSEKLGWE
jgi:hypothetical protein